MGPRGRARVGRAVYGPKITDQLAAPESANAAEARTAKIARTINVSTISFMAFTSYPGTDRVARNARSPGAPVKRVGPNRRGQANLTAGLRRALKLRLQPLQRRDPRFERRVGGELVGPRLLGLRRKDVEGRELAGRGAQVPLRDLVHVAADLH